MEQKTPLGKVLELIPRLPDRSAFHSREQWESASQRVLNSHFFRKPQEAARLMLLLMTPKEKRDFLMRVAVLRALMQGKSYRLITYELGIASQTIAVIRKAITGTPYLSYYQRSKTERKKRTYYVAVRGKGHDPMMRRRGTKYGSSYVSF